MSHVQCTTLPSGSNALMLVVVGTISLYFGRVSCDGNGMLSMVLVGGGSIITLARTLAMFSTLDIAVMLG